MSFILTGSGRTGTLFLAKVLAMSRKWIVRHEHWEDSKYVSYLTDPKDISRIKKAHIKAVTDRFQGRERYGEVNSFLREVALDVGVKKVAVLIRHPDDILLSSLNKQSHRLPWFTRPGWESRLEALRRALETTHRLIAFQECPFFRFEEFTTDKNVLTKLIRWTAIDDVPIQHVSIERKVNSAGRTLIQSLDQLSEEQREMYQISTDWFTSAYYSDWEKDTDEGNNE